MDIIYNKNEQNYLFRYKCKKCKNILISKRGSVKDIKNHKNVCLKCRNRNRLNKKVEFKNLLTNQIIKSDSITNFCNLTSLGKNAKYHFYPVLKGLRLHYKQWGLNKKYNFDSSKIKFVTQTLLKRALV